MFYQLNLLLLLIAPLLAYLAAALMFSLVARQKTNQSLPQNTESVRFRGGHYQ
jgi:ABC-type bacteriocin/lantibiotic exporter with double-glycine peptidase domain